MLLKSQTELDAIYNRIAHRYNLMNSVMTGGTDILVRKKAASLVGNGVILDIGCGTGVSARPFLDRNPGNRVIGLDRSEKMISEGLHVRRLLPVLGDAKQLPLRDNSLDGAVSGFVFRPMDGDRAVISEVSRVLKPGSAFVIYDTLRPPGGIKGFLYCLMLRSYIPIAARILTGDAESYRYLVNSINASVTGEEIANRLRETGFIGIRTRYLLWGAITMLSAQKP